MKQIILFVLTFLVSTSIQSQSEIDVQENFNIDSLITHLDIDTSDWHKILAEINAAPPMDTVTIDRSLGIAKDTSYASKLLNESIGLMNKHNYDLAYSKADSARQIYIVSIGYECKEVADCLYEMGRSSFLLNNILHAKNAEFISIRFFLNSSKVEGIKISNVLNVVGALYHSNFEFNKAVIVRKIVLNLRTSIFGNTDLEVAKAYNNLGVTYLSLENFLMARDSYLKALKIRITILGKDHLEVGNLYNNLGVLYSQNENYVEAIIYLEKSLKIKKSNLGEFNKEVAKSHTNLGVAYKNNGDYLNAIICQNKALEIQKKVFNNLNNIEIAGTLNNLGTLYESIGKPDEAIDFHNKALSIYLNLRSNNHEDVARCYSNLATSYYSLGDYLKAIEYNKLSIGVRKNIFGSDNLNLATSYDQLGISYDAIGDYKKAMEYCKKALEIQLKLSTATHISYFNLGNIYYSINDYPMAILYYFKALEIMKKLHDEDHPNIGRIYGSIGIAYESIGNSEKALYYKILSMNVLTKKLEPLHLDLASAYMNLAISYKNLGNIATALELHLKAIDIKEKIHNKNHPLLIKSHLNTGDLYYIIGDTVKAVNYYYSALNNLEQSTSHSGTDNKDIHFALSKHYYILNQFDSSLFFIFKSISVINNEMKLNNFEKHLSQINSNLMIYEMALKILLKISLNSNFDSYLNKIFDIAELSKASILNSQINKSNALKFSSIPDSLTQKEYKLRVEINWQEKQKQGLLNIGKVETDPEVLNISSIIFDLKRSQEELINLFEKEYPDYYYLKYDTKTISLEETRNSLLKQGETLLEYFVGDSNIYAFVVRPDTFHVEQIKLDFNLDSLVKQLQTGLYGYYGVPVSKRLDAVYKSSLSDYDNAANELYQRIIAPIQTYLTRDVIIVPDGVLGYVPFDALIKSKPIRTGDFKAYQYMINDHNISYTYSATLLKQMRDKKHKKTPTKSLVAFAPFFRGSYVQLDTTIKLVFDTLDDGRDTTIFENYVTRKDYTELPSSGEEVKSASALWKGDYYINTDATEQKFYDVAGDYKIVHLSTHGVADTRQGDYSYLTFSEIKDSIENEYLYVRDIYNTQLNADLVVLSACETAQGELQRGEGIISLARAFAYAGVKSIITTLWVVDDKATKDIMRDFYIELKKGKTKANSLRNAKLKYLQTAKKPNRHPFFWGSFIPLGDMQEIK